MNLKTFATEEAKVLKCLEATDPAQETERYWTILGIAQELCRVAVNSIDAEERLRFFADELAEMAADRAPAPEDNIVTFPVTVPDEAEGKSEEEWDPPHHMVPDEPEVGYTLDEVKAAFTAAAKDGIKVSEIINDAGYAKLSDVPSEKYPALMTALAVKRTEAQA